MSNHERTVAFGYVDEERVSEHIQRQQTHDQGKISLGSVIDAVPKFIRVENYTMFLAEYAVQNDEDIVIHFFLPPSLQRVLDYWTMVFPTALDRTARSYFNAERPRLQAKYTAEMVSWWFKAHGYGHIIDLKTFIQGFFAGLDASLKDKGLA